MDIPRVHADRLPERLRVRVDLVQGGYRVPRLVLVRVEQPEVLLLLAVEVEARDGLAVVVVENPARYDFASRCTTRCGFTSLQAMALTIGYPSSSS
jgi:hypothetical protein